MAHKGEIPPPSSPTQKMEGKGNERERSLLKCPKTYLEQTTTFTKLQDDEHTPELPAGFHSVRRSDEGLAFYVPVSGLTSSTNFFAFHRRHTVSDRLQSAYLSQTTFLPSSTTKLQSHPRSHSSISSESLKSWYRQIHI